MSFADLQLPPHLLSALKAQGHDHPTEIQSKAIPLFREGKDLFALSPTGTGKTGAFALSILAQTTWKQKHPQALIVTPTRELAIQVATAFKAYAQDCPGCSIVPIYGGQPYDTQIKALKRGAHIVVGTPGRIMDHIKQGHLKLAHLSTVVLDEADEMLNMGFVDDIEWILSHIESPHQTALFSATLSPEIKKIANRYLNNPTYLEIKKSQQAKPNIQQYAMMVPASQKLSALMAYLENEDLQSVLIFVRTKKDAADMAEKLMVWGYRAAALHGDMAQNMRERVIEKVIHGKISVLVATDVAARGIDIDTIDHVINFDLPREVDTYVHRIGRTGRAGRAGKALLFTPSKTAFGFKNIEKKMGPIEIIPLPSEAEIRARREEKLSAMIFDLVVKRRVYAKPSDFAASVQRRGDVTLEEIIDALVALQQRKQPPIPKAETFSKKPKRKGYSGKPKTRSFDREKRSFDRKKSWEKPEGKNQKAKKTYRPKKQKRRDQQT